MKNSYVTPKIKYIKSGCTVNDNRVMVIKIYRYLFKNQYEDYDFQR